MENRTYIALGLTTGLLTALSSYYVLNKNFQLSFTKPVEKEIKKDIDQYMLKLDRELREDLFVCGMIQPQNETGLLSYEDFDRIFRII